MKSLRLIVNTVRLSLIAKSNTSSSGILWLALPAGAVAGLLLIPLALISGGVGALLAGAAKKK